MDPDALDRQLVAVLLEEPRADVQTIAEQTEMVPTTVQKRLRALESGGVLDGYTVRIDYESLGYIPAVVRLDVDIELTGEVTAQLAERRPFVTIHEMSGPHNVFAVGYFEDDDELNRTLRELLETPIIDGVEADRIRIHEEAEAIDGIDELEAD